MSHSESKRKDIECLKEALECEAKTVNIRLREGEYQFSLAKAIASFELELAFPDVKDLVKKLFGDKHAEDLQFVSKIQTILKKMEKSGVVKILPKNRPWERQRYTLSSFKFLDVEKSQVVLATKPEIDKALNLISTQPELIHTPDTNTKPKKYLMTSLILLLTFVTAGSIAVTIWTLAQTTINLFVFGSFFCVAVACSILLGIVISKKSSARNSM
jgi:hypothetical protein